MFGCFHVHLYCLQVLLLLVHKIYIHTYAPTHARNARHIYPSILGENVCVWIGNTYSCLSQHKAHSMVGKPFLSTTTTTTLQTHTHTRIQSRESTRKDNGKNRRKYIRKSVRSTQFFISTLVTVAIVRSYVCIVCACVWVWERVNRRACVRVLFTLFIPTVRYNNWNRTN